MESTNSSFFNLQPEVYHSLPKHLSDTSVGSLSQVCTTSRDSLNRHVSKRWYWERKLEREGILYTPVRIDAKRLYIDLVGKESDRNLIRKYLYGVILLEEIQELFNLAIIEGTIYLAELLLKDKRLDPSADYNCAILTVSEKGYLELVRLLLQDERVDPSADHNYAIGISSANGHLEVVKLLLQDKRVDPSDDNNFAIRMASENGHLEVVSLLLEYGATL